MTNDQELLLYIMNIIGNTDYINDYNKFTLKLTNDLSPIGKLDKIMYNIHNFTGSHVYNFCTYENKMNFNNNQIKTDLTLLFMNSIGIFMESNDLTINIENIDGFYYNNDVKNYKTI